MLHLVDKLAKDVRASTPVPSKPSWKALLQRRFNEDFAKAPPRSGGTMEREAAPAELERAWLSALRRASQAWICIWEGLGRDSGLCDVYDVQGEPMSRTVSFLAHLDLAGLMLKWVKETSCYCSALGLQQEETNTTSLTKVRGAVAELGLEQPPVGCLGWGWVARRCKWMMAPRRSMGRHFRWTLFLAAQNVLYLKRGMPCMRRPDLAAGLHDHHDVLTSVHPETSETILEEVEATLRDLVAEVFKGAVFHPREVFPSLNASYGHSRSIGGAWGALLDRALSEGLEDASATTYLEPSQLLGMVEFEPGMVYERRRDAVGEEILGRLADSVSRAADCNPSRLQSLRLISARPSSVAEPCKNRVVTAGEAECYQRSFALQSFMHGVLRRHTLFEYIGRPISHGSWPFDELEGGQWSGVLQPGQFYVSGDYKGATDNLNPRLSLAAWTAICRVVRVDEGPERERRLLFDTPWYWLGSQCLVGHYLDYDKCYPSAPTTPVPQRWGQLMGSPMSFPILNLVNAAATIASQGYTPRSERFRGSPKLPFYSATAVGRSIAMKTNGDDICFLTDKSGYAQWRRFVTACGLEPSLGKNYTSRDFVIMNSEMRMRRPSPRPLTEEVAISAPAEGPYVWEPVGFLNLPLLFGLDAKGQYAGQSILDRTAWWQIGSLWRTLCCWVPDDISRIRAKRARAYYREVLDRVPPGVSYWAPESLGGLGLPASPEDLASVPADNRQRCAWLACLDERTRAEQLTPPAPRRPDWISFLIKKARKAIAVRTRIVSTPDDCFERRLTLLNREPVDLLAMGLKFLARHEVFRAQVWQILRSDKKPKRGKTYALDKAAMSEESARQLLMEKSDMYFSSDVSAKVIQDPASTEGQVLERQVLEAAMATRIKGQCRKSLASGLAPMSPSTFAEWVPQKVLLEEELLSGVTPVAVRLPELYAEEAWSARWERLSLSPDLGIPVLGVC